MVLGREWWRRDMTAMQTQRKGDRQMEREEKREIRRERQRQRERKRAREEEREEKSSIMLIQSLWELEPKKFKKKEDHLRLN